MKAFMNIINPHQKGKVTTMIVYYTLLLLLLALWIPVTIDKFLDYSTFKISMIRQPFADNLGHIVALVLPPFEVLTVVLLFLKEFRKYGFLLSASLLLVFSGYIGIALLGAWENLPCGCGLVISGMGWGQHLLFNLFFLAISIGGCYLHRNIIRNRKP